MIFKISLCCRKEMLRNGLLYQSVTKKNNVIHILLYKASKKFNNSRWFEGLTTQIHKTGIRSRHSPGSVSDLNIHLTI